MRDDNEAPRLRTAMLMPSSAPRPALRRPAPKSAGERGRVYGSTANEREYSALREQLSALEQDIAEARSRLRRAQQLHPLGAPRLAPPSSHGEAVVLRDGSRILIRPVEPGDVRALREGFEHLGEVSRYRRFLTPIEHLSREQLEYLTHIDHDRHEALGAVDPVSGEGIGIARYVRNPHDPSEAEAAIVVTDAWQHRGVGEVLAGRLAERARAAGVERLTARLLIGNHAARRLLERVGEPISVQADGGTVRVTARLRR